MGESDNNNNMKSEEALEVAMCDVCDQSIKAKIGDAFYTHTVYPDMRTNCLIL